MRRFRLTVFGAIVLGLIAFALTACGGSPANPNAPTSVLVATHLIQKGTPGAVMTRKRYYRIVRIPKNQTENGALSDPSALESKVALRDVVPGEQLTADQFGAATG